tara:strand:+ start:435 stop:611 length:177 start_codon:yes stop_codon:yes gene_type:complete
LLTTIQRLKKEQAFSEEKRILRAIAKVLIPDKKLNITMIYGVILQIKYFIINIFHTKY